MKTPEDDEFDRIEREQAMGWRKRQIVNEIEKNMNNKIVAWMFRGYLYEKDPSGWTVHEHPNVPVIPLYTHPAKTLTDEEILESFAFYFGSTLNNKAYNDGAILFAKDILRKAQEK
jgi:hypothetical protein